jgi:hypothetical protein
MLRKVHEASAVQSNRHPYDDDDDDDDICVLDLGHLLAHSGLTCPEVSSKVCQSGSIVSLPWVIYYEALCLHVLFRFSSIPVICPKLELFLSPLQFVYLFVNLSQCILLFSSCTSSPLLTFCYRPLL